MPAPHPAAETPPRLPDPAALVGSLMSMMAHFSCLGCPRLASRIRHGLSLLPHYADDEMPPLLKQLAARLENGWAQLEFALSDESEPADRNDPYAALPAASQSLH